MAASHGWNRTASGYTARSPDVLMQALSRIGTLNSSRRFVWRGAADYRWRLASSLIRMQRALRPPTELEIRNLERAAIREARGWGIGRELGASATDLHVLALLQHHGVPTRLLDVTSNPMTALYFACHPPRDPEVAGVLFAFDVTGIETYSTIDDVDAPTYGALQTPRQWTLRHALARSATRQQPLLVVPALPDSRMQAQEGLFITSAVPRHSTFDQVDGLMLTSSVPVGHAPLKDLFESPSRPAGKPLNVPFCAIVIPATVKKRMRKHLESTYNRVDRVLFPDIDGFKEAWNNGRLDTTAPPDTKDPYEDDEAVGVAP